MADGTKIEWTDATWNPITGCSVVSPGCTNCYAMKLAGTRLKHHPTRAGLTMESKAGPVWNGQVRLNESMLHDPLKWRRPRMIFVCAHGDLFAENVPDEWIDQVFAVMALAPQHTFQVLTKRPERMRAYLARPISRIVHDAVMLATRDQPEKRRTFLDRWPGGIIEDYIDGPIAETLRAGWPLPNVWLGVSVEDQKRAEERIPVLLETPAAVRWISAEPLLGAINLTRLDIGLGYGANALAYPSITGPGRGIGRLDWIVAGGESGRDARPIHPDWARSLRDQCAAAGVPFLFKQWGEFGPAFGPDLMPTGLPWSGEAQRAVARGTATVEQATRRLGKRVAGRLLDGVEHNAFPTTPQREAV